ncbi:hypothetical protein B0H16DRAFT_823082 [Mycena metata]|uniref:Uncharacterized protein n=1 Tax=Mycena metata TaxID=1033252 RepID=A0AAD7IW06_9AGAR|nr:hypothetical protein B0H16DRAFT_823082 [Mycena metata]
MPHYGGRGWRERGWERGAGWLHNGGSNDEGDPGVEGVGVHFAKHSRNDTLRRLSAFQFISSLRPSTSTGRITSTGLSGIRQNEAENKLAMQSSDARIRLSSPILGMRERCRRCVSCLRSALEEEYVRSDGQGSLECSVPRTRLEGLRSRFGACPWARPARAEPACGEIVDGLPCESPLYWRVTLVFLPEG